MPGVLLGRPRPRASDRRAHYEMLQFSSHLQIFAIITYAHICARYLLFIAPLMTDTARHLAALIAESEESDRRLAALLQSTRELIARTDAMLAEERPQ